MFRIRSAISILNMQQTNIEANAVHKTTGLFQKYAEAIIASYLSSLVHVHSLRYKKNK